MSNEYGERKFYHMDDNRSFFIYFILSRFLALPLAFARARYKKTLLRLAECTIDLYNILDIKVGNFYIICFDNR